MKKINYFLYLLVFPALMLISCTNVFATSSESHTVASKKAEVDIGVEFIKSKEKVVPKDKDTIYKPGKTEDINKLLPHTGETILSFIIILVGFSIVLFISGIYILNKTMKINSLIYED